MKPTRIWMAIVNDVNEVVFKRACQSRRKAERAIVEYLQNNDDFDGKDFNEACFWIGEKDRRLDVMVFEMVAEDFKPVWDQLAMFRSDLPLTEKGLYRVIYEIDVGAGSAIEAARQVYQIMTDSDSMPPVLDVIDNKRNKIRMDLSHCKKKRKRSCQTKKSILPN